MHQRTLRTATCLALSTAVISGLANFFNKQGVLAVGDPLAYTIVKNGVVGILLAGLIIAIRKYAEIRTLSLREWLYLMAIGIVGGSVPFGLFFTGLTMTSAINASLIHKTLFAWVALLAMPLLGERFSRFQWLGVACIFAANLAVGGFKGFSYNTGEVMILVATLLWALENVIAKVALRTISSSVVACARMTIGSITFGGYLLATRPESLATVIALTPTQWAWVAFTSLLLFGYVTTWYAALKRAPATYVATLLTPATLVTNVLSAMFVTHAFAPSDFTKAALYIGGAALVVVFARKAADRIAMREALETKPLR